MSAPLERPQREYRITWRGDSHVIAARSGAAARYASWKAFREAGYEADLPTFAGMITITLNCRLCGDLRQTLVSAE